MAQKAILQGGPLFRGQTMARRATLIVDRFGIETRRPHIIQWVPAWKHLSPLLWGRKLSIFQPLRRRSAASSRKRAAASAAEESFHGPFRSARLLGAELGLQSREYDAEHGIRVNQSCANDARRVGHWVQAMQTMTIPTAIAAFWSASASFANPTIERRLARLAGFSRGWFRRRG
jgi:hypothetical protein